MQSQLIVKNFGPIEYVDLNLRNVNVFIGPQASGKSALAKIYTIFKAPRKFLNDIKSNVFSEPATELIFNLVLEEYNVASFLRKDTEITFTSELHSLCYKNGKLEYTPKLLQRIEQLSSLKESFSANLEEIKKIVLDFTNNFLLFNFDVFSALRRETDEPVGITTIENIQNIDEDNFETILKSIRKIENNLSTNAALYIPAERNFINIIKNASLNLLLNNVPIPKHILSFGAEVEKAGLKDIDLSFLQENLRYKSVDGEDRIFTGANNSIKLTEAASGIQSVIPILLPILSHRTISAHRSFVIEEPELNLFPIAQYKLIKQLESSRKESYWEDYGTIHTYTTHSPYILSAINNLLYANKVLVKIKTLNNINEKNKAEEQLKQIIPHHINPYYFTAYQISNGKAESIFDAQTGLIQDNFIDNASDAIADDFDALMELMNQLN
ncbi:MAG: hypothetical protein JWP69_1344 [Flaviaesturariibacter sp.]|nr:hypothetical protein [Flaviaesturariibacter sp.]